MKHQRIIIAFLLSIIVSTFIWAADEKKEVKYIGSIEMKENKEIVLMLRVEGEGENEGTVGDAMLVYGPTDKDYQSIIEHVGGIKPGESKLVPAWESE